MPFIALGKWKLFDGLQINSGNILRRANMIDTGVDKACNVREEGAQGE